MDEFALYFRIIYVKNPIAIKAAISNRIVEPVKRIRRGSSPDNKERKRLAFRIEGIFSGPSWIFSCFYGTWKLIRECKSLNIIRKLLNFCAQCPIVMKK